jgi:hypothetical protein
MKNIQIYNQILTLKQSLLVDGFIIDGIFGSYAREEETAESDVDILYHLEENFYEKYNGFSGFKKLDEIKNMISKSLNKNIDLAPKNNLSKTAQKYILNEVVYV